MRKFLSILLTLLAAAAVLALMLDPLVRQMLYPAPPVAVPSPPPAPLEEVRLALPDGEHAVAWAYRQEDPASPAVVFFHGNGENLETLRYSGLYDQLAELGIHFLAVDFPGYGRSSGKPSQASLTAAGEAGLAWIGERHPASPRVVLGWSLGAAVAIQTAARQPEATDGLILLSAWADLPSLAAVHYPSWLVKLGLADRYDSLAAAAQIRSPVLMIHGELDAIIPIGEGRRLHQALQQALQEDAGRFVEVPDAGHNDLLARRVVWEEMASFLSRLAAGR